MTLMLPFYRRYGKRIFDLLIAVPAEQHLLRSETDSALDFARDCGYITYYADTLGDPSTGSGHRLPGITLMPEAPWGRCTRWLTCITVDPQAFGAGRETIRVALEKENIESRPLPPISPSPHLLVSLSP